MKFRRTLTILLLTFTLLLSPAFGQRHKHRRTYRNVEGHQVQSPVFRKSAPAGATAKCRDGSYSFSQHHRGTCSHHGGVAEWLD
jgi:hypothetical protein